MFEVKDVNHHIQKYILLYLMEHKFARFRDMRPPKTDTNLYSYHLKLLQKQHFVEKAQQGYTLGVPGQLYVDRINANSAKLSPQPKVITMLVIQNDVGGVLMYPKLRQPFIERWTVPFGKVHNGDASILEAAKREAREKVAVDDIDLRHAGDCYIRVRYQDDVTISSLAHIFYGQTDQHSLANDHLKWIPPHKIDSIETAPAMKKIIARTFFQDPYFFEEFDETWYDN